MSTRINKKINRMFILMNRLAEGEELYEQDEGLQENLGGINKRTLDRYLKDIHELYGNIVLTEKKKKEFTDREVTIYRVADRKKDVSQILKFFIENSNDLGWVLQMINENDPSFLKELDERDRHDIEKNIKEDEGVFVFKSTPFENMETAEQKKIFSQLKKAVKNHEYRTIVYDKNKTEELKDLKCLKLVYMDNNWYLATENEEKKFRFLRLSFMKDVKYASEGKTTFQSARVEEQNRYFDKVQNANTLVGVNFKKAELKVSPKVAIYFKKSMKPFFPTQKYIQTEEDGSVVFSVEYTQPLEILPFVKKWQPDMSIISPVELKNALIEDLKKSIANHA